MVAGRYELIRPLGRGGMGAVWLGEDNLAGRQVAVKELRAPEGVGDEERDVFSKRVLREARIAARLSHPNAVILHDIIPATPDDDAVYLVMEYVDGVNLAQLVQRDGPLPAEQAADLAVQLLSVLEAAHRLGFVHRDIKPSNIMVTASGQVKLADFGIAQLVGGTRLTGGGVIGTPAYMAPEQLQSFAVSPAIDLWSLGVTLYGVVEGHNPFDRDTTAATFMAILMADLPVPTCGPPLDAVISGLLVRDPEQRITISRARQLLAGATVWSGMAEASAGVPAIDSGGPNGRTSRPGGASGRPGGPSRSGGSAGVPGSVGPATDPGSQGAPGNPTRPGDPSYPTGPARPVAAGVTKPFWRRRAAVVAAAGAAALVAAVAVALTVLQPGSANSPSGQSATSRAASPPASSTAGQSTTAAVQSTTSASPPVASSEVPNAYLGKWQGTLTDNTGLEGPQAAQLSITGGAVNSTVGTASYPNVGCTYSFRLYSVQANQITLYEEIQSGPCESEYVVLTPDSGSLTDDVYLALYSGTPPEFSGKLSRTS